jgi:diazepam-binding inhibitor (GABA receptor modulating acyl-CoA-binding protein)
MTEYTIKDQFDYAVQQVRDLPASDDGPSDQEKLDMYGLYKQATIGNCVTSQPSMFSFEAKAKWSAWVSRKKMSKEDAMLAYCNKYLTIHDRYC